MIKTQASSNGIPIDPRDQRIAELEAQLRERDQLIAALQEKVQHLEEELKKTKRAGKRQAAPFARKKRVAKPKRPGRKKGQGRFSYRRKPAPEQVKETKEAALNCCPECGGSLTERKEHEQLVVDILPVEPEITRYVTYSGYSSCCQQRVRSCHADQISDATGAAGVVVGPRAKALAADMKHRLGLSYGKVCDLLDDAFGLCDPALERRGADPGPQEDRNDDAVRPALRRHGRQRLLSGDGPGREPDGTGRRWPRP